MDDQQRGRSPSTGHHGHIRHSQSPSPQAAFHSTISGLGIAQAIADDSSSSFDSNLAAQLPPSGQTPFDLSQQFLASSQPQQQFPEQPALLHQHPFLQAQSLPPRSTASPPFGQPGGGYSPNLLAINSPPPTTTSASTGTPNGAFDPQLFQPSPGSDALLDQQFSLDPHLLDGPPAPDQSIDPASLVSPMATAQTQSPTPPHLLQPEMHPSAANSPHASPSLAQAAFPSPNHSRHTSLDPASAAFPQGQPSGWESMHFRTHRRAPSEYSDVSSAHASPYLGNIDSFDGYGDHSPSLPAQQDPALFPELNNFNSISISEPVPAHISPVPSAGPSPHVSPRLGPQQQPLPPFTAANNFGLTALHAGGGQFGPAQGMDMFPATGSEPFPTLPSHHNGSVDLGQADQMSPPDITVDFAPPSRQPSFEPARDEKPMQGALSPPERTGRSRNRVRAKSDTYLSSRHSSPGIRPDAASLRPESAKSLSRSPSPATKTSRRSSTSSVPHRDYILDLADPTRPGAQPHIPGESTAKRTQKHPATFQCSLCPKRFTRAYNLRSHLRTHTDERPFVCSVCGKAFARQHDRKRHEGLHSGEKKFQCRGQLKDGGAWGCGRRFARADALGRHFRSEAGRVCIRPLLEEEAAEKGFSMQDPGAGGAMVGMNNGLLGQPLMGPQPGLGPQLLPPPQAGFESFPPAPTHLMEPPGAPQFLPQSILQQYPQLANLQWDALPAGDEVDGDISGRSSFDASSGGEMFDDEQEFDMQPQGATGWASDVGY